MSAPIDLPTPLWDLICRAYDAPGRHYHDVSHLTDVLTRFYDVDHNVGWTQPREVYLALVFHDLVYVPGARDNETQSATAACGAVDQWFNVLDLDVDRIMRLIKLTACHGSIEAADVDRDTALFLDVDMAILGGDVETFDEYEQGIAAEYAQLPPATFRIGRRRFLTHLLSRERIFLSDYYHRQLDTRARDNLRRALLAHP